MQLISVLRGKIHGLTVTEANLRYKGSLTLDMNLIEKAGLIPNEKVHVVNVNNGERLETYLIEGQRGTGICCLNGPAARKGLADDEIIVIAYSWMELEAAKKWEPVIVFPGKGNKLE